MMVNAVQIFDNFLPSELSAPDTLNLDVLDINNINGDFVISRDTNGNVLSRYKDMVWNFEPYTSDPSQHPMFYFEKNIQKKEIQSVKKLMLLLIIYGNGREGSQYSVGTLKHYFTSIFKPLSEFVIRHNLDIQKCLEDRKNLLKYIDEECYNRQRVSHLVSLLSFLHYRNNNQTKINYQYDEEVIQKLHKLRSVFVRGLHQTEIIPLRILSESLSQRWEQIKEVEKNIHGIKNFLKLFLENHLFASSKHKNNKTLSFRAEAKKYNLLKIFAKYNIKNRRDFLEFIIHIQGTCSHLIHAYTGMRRGEVLNLTNNCTQEVSNESGVCYLISTTSKLKARSETAKWVTSKETKRIIMLLNVLNESAEHYRTKNFDELPLFILFSALLKTDIPKRIIPKRKFLENEQLPLDKTKITITVEDKEQVEYIDITNSMKKINIGEVWNFKSHQYRRSLAIYSIQSGIVSLGALQKQLKHIFREMTLYYANGASLARKIFDVPKEHIAKDFDKLKPEIDALVYIRDVLFSDEKLYGTHGKLIEKNKDNTHKDLDIFLADNREKITKKFQQGEIAYKETAIGACVSIEACDSSLTRSFSACIECDSSILKKTNLENTIRQQKAFLDCLNKDSIEYRTELDELKSLENIQKKLIKE